MGTMNILYKKTSRGLQEWQITVSENTMITTHGMVGGKLQVTTDTITEGKNVGKKNETTPEQQAEAEAFSRWEKQKKKGYVESLEGAMSGHLDALIKGGIEPMLAPSKIYPTFATKLSFPVYVQPKLDGSRLIAILKGGQCTLWSRTRKQVHSLPHIARAVEAHFGKFGDLILDGEAFSYEYRNSFEDLMSLIRSDEPAPGHEVVDYHIYDLPSSKCNFGTRNFDLDVMMAGASPPLVLVKTETAIDHDEIMRLHEINLAMEYEGSMIRNDGPYECGKRSYHLQKLKNFVDQEFKIAGAEEGRGKDAGTIGAFVCEEPLAVLDDGTIGPDTFKVRLKATYKRRRELFEHPEQYKDQNLTVTFQNRTARNIPRFPIGKGLRSPSGD
jgi:DNA ligase-1